MRFSSIAFGLASLLSLAVATEPVELEFVPRHVWDPHLQKRQDPSEPANVTLLDHEELVWTTPNNTEKHTTVSMIVWTRQDELIIDMARFAFQLKSVNCTSNMTLQFYHKKAFDAAIKQWEWVNFNNIRSFVMIADHLKCGKDWSLDPWVVSNARYDEKKLIVSLDARKKTWKQVTNSYTVDFGETSRSRDVKRWLDFDLSKAFTIPLTTKFPTKIFAQKWANADFAVNCVDCGTSGGLTFAGHIEGSPFGGVDVLTVSVTPDNIQANLGLEVSFGGSYNFSGKSDARREFELLEIPLPSSWSIPGILHFGPKAKVIAGYELESISGRATVSTGITATIPSDSIAKVEIFGNKKLDIHGWVPTFQTQPLTIEAEITIEAELYAGIAVAVSLEILDDTGINLDLNLKFPELEVTARGGYDPNGFCPNNNNPFGVELNVALGAEIELIAWDEIDGNRHNIFEVDLYENEEIFKFPPLCISFGSETPGSCAVTPDVEDEEDLPSKARRSGYIGGSTGMVSRSPQANDPPVGVFARARRYFMACDNTNRKNPIVLKEHYLPGEIINKDEAGVAGGVPVLYPLLSCADTSPDDCQPEKWQVKEIQTVEDDDDADDDDNDADGDGVIRDAGARLSVGSWAAEHVYEGNWIRNYLDYLYKNHFQDKNDADRCKHIAETIFKIGTEGGVADKLVSSIGNKQTYKTTMVLLTQKENDYKYRYFDPKKEIDASLRDSKFALGPATCALGRVLNTCKYLEHSRTQEYMKNTLRALDAVLTGLDGSRDPNDGGPDSYRAAHQKFFMDQYNAGITKGRAAVLDYAQKVTKLNGFANLVQPLKDDIEKKLAVEAEVAKLCHPTDFVYPTT